MSSVIAAKSNYLGVNEFSLSRYGEIIIDIKNHGYEFCTLKEYFARGLPARSTCVIRHDVDCKPSSLIAMLDVEQALDIRSTIFARVTADDYNICGMISYKIFKDAQDNRFEIGLHTSCVEHSEITGIDVMQLFSTEIDTLRSLGFDVVGVSPHRDVNYAFNTLPWLERNWSKLSQKHNLSYQAYDRRFMNIVSYVNEGLNPHLCWRSLTPQDVARTGKSMCVLTHPHWWYKQHPFEVLR